MENAEPKLYEIVRFFQNEGSEVLERDVTLGDAKAHCRGTESSSLTCTRAAGKKITTERGPWFDGFRAQE